MDSLLKVQDIIGRALVVTEKADDLGKGQTPVSKINGNSGKRYDFIHKNSDLTIFSSCTIGNVIVIYMTKLY